MYAHIHMHTFMQPSMNQARKDLVMKAFQKFDKTGDGIITVADLKR